jgi:hypothetical protein
MWRLVNRQARPANGHLRRVSGQSQLGNCQWRFAVPRVLPNNFQALIAIARSSLHMTQEEFGAAMLSSTRTVARWEKGQSTLVGTDLIRAARLVHRGDRELADHMARQAGTDLVRLGLEQPSPKPEAHPVHPALHVADLMLCSAARAIGSTPEEVRPALQAAIRRALALGVTLDEVDQALQAPPEEAPVPPNP